MTAIHRLGAIELAHAYRARALDPVEVTTALLARIAALEPRLNAMVLVDAEGALAAARASAERFRRGTPLGPLDGVPALVKDILLMRGFATRRGSLATEGVAPDVEDAPSVAALRDAGCPLVGKTTTAEYGWKAIGDCPHTGVTHNPWSLSHTPGGSSGGAAAAVAAGYAPLAIGTDGAGSIRVPSAFTGGFGLKPTFGRVPAYPASPFGLVAHVGPMTRNVADAAAMLEAMARPDPRDWLPVQGGLRPGEFSAGLAQGVAGLKVAFSPALGRAAVDPTIAEAVARAARLFADMGADVEAFDPPLDDIRDAFLVLWTAASAQAVRHLSTDARARLDPGLQDSASRGRLWSAMHMTEADMVRVRTGEALARFLTRFDLLLTPTVPVPALPVGRDLLADGPDAYWIDWSPFSLPFNFSRQPAATVPCGVTATGLPIGLQIVGAAHRDALVLRAAAAFERAAPFASAPLE